MGTDLGRVAYEAYCETRGWKSFNGDPLPQWGLIKEDIAEGWRVAANAVRDELQKESKPV